MAAVTRFLRLPSAPSIARLLPAGRVENWSESACWSRIVTRRGDIRLLPGTGLIRSALERKPPSKPAPGSRPIQSLTQRLRPMLVAGVCEMDAVVSELSRDLIPVEERRRKIEPLDAAGLSQQRVRLTNARPFVAAPQERREDRAQHDAIS